MLTNRNEPGRHIGAGGHTSRPGRFSTRNHPVAVLVSNHELLLDRAILRYHRQTLPQIPYIDGAGVQRVYRTWNEPNLDVDVGDDVLNSRSLFQLGMHPSMISQGNSP